MTNDEFRIQLKRIQYAITTDVVLDEAYINELYRKFGMLSLETWTAIVTHVVDELAGHKKAKLPRLNDFNQAHEAIRAVQASTTEVAKMSPQENHDWLMQTALTMKPAAIRRALQFATEMKSTYPADVLEVMKRRAADE